MDVPTRNGLSTQISSKTRSLLRRDKKSVSIDVFDMDSLFRQIVRWNFYLVERESRMVAGAPDTHPRLKKTVGLVRCFVGVEKRLEN